MRRFAFSPSPRALFCAVLLTLAGQAVLPAASAAAGLNLGMPIACVPGQNCWIMHYPDLDKSKGKGFRDYRCGSMTYDTHKGTDFTIEGLAAMTRGVPVLAAAAGTVRVTREGMDDVNVRTIGLDAVRGKTCGNAAIINHPGGWSTQYCHMRKGSLRV
jgi:murein DD-endopeptidase MepM/ murein hydrolase activator NlpD